MNTLLAGATGLVGREISACWPGPVGGGTLHRLVRRAPDCPLAGQPAQVVDFAALPVLPPATGALCALGTTIGTAGSQAAFRRVDHDAVLAFAHAARAAGVDRFVVVSTLGADAASRSFYNRVKGETEAALAHVGFGALLVCRPSLLDGDRSMLGQTPRRAEQLALALARPLSPLLPARWRPIAATTVARAMLRLLAGSDRGLRVVESAELQALGR